MSTSSTSWTAIESKTSTIVHERPLGTTELGFYWDSQVERTADTLRYAEVRVSLGERDQVITPSRVIGIWTSLKSHFPLLGARLVERDERSVFFVVTEERLQALQKDEVTFIDVASSKEALAFVDKIIAKERLLSDNLLARIFILRHTREPDLFHFVIHAAHCVSDEMANITVLKTFLNALCGSSVQETRTLKESLELSVASEDLDPNRYLPTPRRLWRKAIATVIGAKRIAKRIVSLFSRTMRLGI